MEPRSERPDTPRRLNRIKTRHHVEIGPLEHCLPGSIKGRPETVVRAETLRSLRIIEGPVLPRAGYAGTLLSPEEYARCATQPRREDCAFAPGAADVHQVRDMGYGRHKQKVAAPSETPYELVCGDFVGTESRVEHIVRRMRLPRSNGIPESVGGFPRFFVVNYMLPDYAAPLLSPGDGPGRSLVLFFRLRTDFDPETFPHRQAIPLMLRFFNGEQEQNGEPSRDRLKLVARVMNLKQWGELGGLSSYQVNLLGKYNGKPVMTRPQHAFYRGSDYLEVDLNCHQWNFIARKTLSSMRGRIHVMDSSHAFVVQGNTDDQLPEVVLCCARVTGLDMSDQPRPAPAAPEEMGITSEEALMRRKRELHAESLDLERRGMKRVYWEDGDDPDLRAGGRRRTVRRRRKTRETDEAPPSFWWRATTLLFRPVRGSIRLMGGTARMMGKMVVSPLAASRKCGPQRERDSDAW